MKPTSFKHHRFPPDTIWLAVWLNFRFTINLRDLEDLLAERGIDVSYETGRWTNNRVENSHLPFRRRERAMLRLRQMKPLQKFASIHAPFHNHFASDRHLIDQQTYKLHRSAALAEWPSLAT
jgi:putative transposase